jgi:hypothetical protein
MTVLCSDIFASQFSFVDLLKVDEFNSDALLNAVASFFQIFVIVLLVECEKSWRPHLTEFRS